MSPASSKAVTLRRRRHDRNLNSRRPSSKSDISIRSDKSQTDVGAEESVASHVLFTLLLPPAFSTTPQLPRENVASPSMRTFHPSIKPFLGKACSISLRSIHSSRHLGPRSYSLARPWIVCHQLAILPTHLAQQLLRNAASATRTRPPTTLRYPRLYSCTIASNSENEASTLPNIRLYENQQKFTFVYASLLTRRPRKRI